MIKALFPVDELLESAELQVPSVLRFRFMQKVWKFLSRRAAPRPYFQRRLLLIHIALKQLMDAHDVNNVILFLISEVKFWFPLTSSTKVKGQRRIQNCTLGTVRKQDFVEDSS